MHWTYSLPRYEASNLLRYTHTQEEAMAKKPTRKKDLKKEKKKAKPAKKGKRGAPMGAVKKNGNKG